MTPADPLDTSAVRSTPRPPAPDAPQPGRTLDASRLVVLAFASIPVGIAAAVAGLYPLVTMLMARILIGEALPRLGMVAIAIAVVGIVLISIGG